MARNARRTTTPPEIRNMPGDYPFGDRVSESLSDYAKRTGLPLKTIQNRADAGSLPIIQKRPRAKREVNLLAIYMNARYKAERFVESMN
ncbi:DNA-binding protein [Klebsiella michiganensis]|uniref:DNA-binding protein n=1 Tax=Klebsiella TaxID=570 RepID=UPI0023AAFED5|nr:DNA-binding protein [Klebsiella michiganensis]EIX9046439.1 DNA-binding protein [Klebsiella oxytoca]EKU5181754.1 DNA-binding protein [Klebsiella oxytoca]ELT9694275.1 DNA-binding protein [Klebsiella oxytoca]WEF08779.1 DNA-binding protein [Klebsiella michiganensis]HDT4620433.1 DNA-binding protein [Klebsiella oxytoca]